MSNKQENPIVSLVFNVVVPALIMNKLSSPERLGPLYGLLLALAFPVIYSIWDFAKRRHVSFISGLGFISILLTGVFTLVELPTNWIAVKEAAVPSIIGIAIILSMRSKSPLIKKLLYNDSIINVELVESRLTKPDDRASLDGLLVRASYLLASSFLVSAILNFGLARYLLKSAPGTTQFNEELGKMHALSWPVIVIPSMAIMMLALLQLMKGLKGLTGLEAEEILKGQQNTKK